MGAGDAPTRETTKHLAADSKAQGKDLTRPFNDGIVAEATKRASTTAGPPQSQPLRGRTLSTRGSPERGGQSDSHWSSFSLEDLA